MTLRTRIALAVFFFLAWAMFRVIWNAREAAHESSCQGRLCSLQAALRNYEAMNGRLPPAYVRGPDGKPWHSWRVLILPFLGNGEKSAYERYRFDEPWNGPNNRQLEDQINIETFQCCSGSDYQQTFNTNYVAVVGSGTAFPRESTTRFADFADGRENTILLVEVANANIHWMEPRDLTFDSLSQEQKSKSVPYVSSPHPRGPGVVFADKITAYRLRPSVRDETLRALATIAGGEAVTRDHLCRVGIGLMLTEDPSEGMEPTRE